MNHHTLTAAADSITFIDHEPGGDIAVDAVAALITSAFHVLEPAQWLIANPVERGPVLHETFVEAIRAAHHNGEIHLAVHPDQRVLGAAVWLHHLGRSNPQPDPTYPDRLGHHAARVAAFDQTLAAYVPDHRRYHHLALLAVHPDHQGTGIGSALLARHHTTLDTHAIPAYLQAGDPALVEWYRRHGYWPGTPFHLPDAGPPMIPMLRQPTPSPD